MSVPHVPQELWPDVPQGMRQALAAAGLDTVAGAFAYGGGQDLAKPGLGNRRRTRVELPGPDGARHVLFLKRYGGGTAPAVRAALGRWLERGGRCSAAAGEFENIRAARAAGVATMEPIAYGQEACPLGAGASYVLVSAVPGEALERCGEAFLAAHADKCPLNGQIIVAIIMGVCLALFIGVSFLTSRELYDLDKLLHRGKYRVAEEHKVEVIKGGLHLMRLAGVDENFSRGDRVIAYFTFFWGLAPNLVGAVVVAWNLLYERWSNEGWWSYHYFWSVSIPVVGGVITTIWFTWGTSRDMLRLFKDLREAKQDVTDDGQVHEDTPAKPS